MRTWHVMRHAAGGYGVMRGTEMHMHDGQPWSGELGEARAMARQLNRPAAMTSERFAELVGHVPMTAPMQAALRDVLVNGNTWRDAAQRNDVTESGILRATRRIARLNPGCGG